jgi:hypothetical protein
VTVNGGDVTILDGDTFAVGDNGTYTIVFYLLDADGNAVNASKTYSVTLELTEGSPDSQAWMMVDGVKVYGSLASLLNRANAGDTIYLLTSDVIAIEDNAKLYSVNIVPDTDAFGGDSCVILSTNDPDGE